MRRHVRVLYSKQLNNRRARNSHPYVGYFEGFGSEPEAINYRAQYNRTFTCPLPPLMLISHTTYPVLGISGKTWWPLVMSNACSLLFPLTAAHRTFFSTSCLQQHQPANIDYQTQLRNSISMALTENGNTPASRTFLAEYIDQQQEEDGLRRVLESNAEFAIDLTLNLARRKAQSSKMTKYCCRSCNAKWLLECIGEEGTIMFKLQ